MTTAIQASPKPNRRRFLGLFGASGLAAAGVVFGGSSPAQAQDGLCHRACCSLYTCPNVSMTHCRSGADYTWTCKYTSTTGCSCCEHGGLGSAWDGHSAYSCERV